MAELQWTMRSWGCSLTSSSLSGLWLLTAQKKVKVTCAFHNLGLDQHTVACACLPGSQQTTAHDQSCLFCQVKFY
jgi:hypothetical protein